MSKAAKGIDVEALKGQVAGRWPELLSTLGGVAADILDGKNHPCPKCGGKDRFRMIDVAAGALFLQPMLPSGQRRRHRRAQWLRGGTFPETVNALAEHLGQSSQRSSPPAGNGKPRIVATYDYRDERGELLYQVVRFDPKGFRQRRPKGGNGWEYSVKGTRLVPYRLPDLVAAPSSVAVFVVEGEKDADRAAGIGIVATTLAIGAGSGGPSTTSTSVADPSTSCPTTTSPGANMRSKWR